MSIKLIRVQSGEDIICDINEMVVGGEDNPKVVGYFLKRPCVVLIRNPHKFGDVNVAEQKASLEVSLIPWMPLAKDDVIPISLDWVITMVTPTDKLTDIYLQEVMKDGDNNKDSGTTEQSNSDNSD